MAKKGEGKWAELKQRGLTLLGLEKELAWPEVMKQMREQMREQRGPPIVYPVDLKEISMDIDGCMRYSFRKENQSPNRTIMVLGPTGAGKSTLINGMINYILGVQWEDGFRFKLINEDESKSQAHSQTTVVSVYKINHQEEFQIPHSITIIDTPGFGDTAGIAKDIKITEQIRKLFSSEQGVSEVDAVCFVAQASQVRLTPTQKYVFDSILSIFGKDIADNLQVLVTFADGKQSPVLEAINAAEIPCPKTPQGLPVHFKFNNSALMADNKSAPCQDNDSGDDDSFDTMYWKMGVKSMKRFFSALNRMNTKSLTMTKEVLQERKMLHTVVEGLQVQVREGLAKLDTISQHERTLKQNEAEIKANVNFEYYTDTPKTTLEDISKTGDYITNCLICSRTCHYPCILNDAEKRDCGAIDSDTGNCRVCPKKCSWEDHKNQQFRYKFTMVKEKHTYDVLKTKYETATNKKLSAQGLLDELRKDYNAHETEVYRKVTRSSNCLNRLKEIALKPDPLSTPEYIDMLIENEKHEAKSGYQARIQSLQDMRRQAEVLAQVAKGEKPLP